jgi:hypothetical protein
LLHQKNNKKTAFPPSTKLVLRVKAHRTALAEISSEISTILVRHTRKYSPAMPGFLLDRAYVQRYIVHPLGNF